MDNTKFELKLIHRDYNKDIEEDIIKKALVVENSVCLCAATMLKLSGKHEKEYIIVTELDCLYDKKIIINENILIICLTYELAVVDLNTDLVKKQMDINACSLFGVYKFKNGYFIHGEIENIYLNEDFDIVWTESCGNIFFNCKIDNDLEIFDNYITSYDWDGYKHYYNEHGEYKTQYFPELDCDSIEESNA